MRYAIDFDKAVNRLVPHYFGGRRLVLFIQACMHPIQSINDAFVSWAKEMRIEASMTSQIFKLEWFLTRKFKGYFENPDARVRIENGSSVGTPIYNEAATDLRDEDHFILYTEKEYTEGEGRGVTLYNENEDNKTSAYSFAVFCPKPVIPADDMAKMLGTYVSRYKLSGKIYQIFIEQ